MPETDKAQSQPDGPKKPDSNALRAAYTRFKLLPIGLRWILSATLAGVLSLAALAFFLPNMKERMKFFTDGTLSWLIFIVVGVQAYIYRRQWEVMERQWKETQRGIESAEKNSIYAQRAYVTAKIRDTGERDNTLQFRLQIEIAAIPRRIMFACLMRVNLGKTRLGTCTRNHSRKCRKSKSSLIADSIRQCVSVLLRQTAAILLVHLRFRSSPPVNTKDLSRENLISFAGEVSPTRTCSTKSGTPRSAFFNRKDDQTATPVSTATRQYKEIQIRALPACDFDLSNEFTV